MDLSLEHKLEAVLFYKGGALKKSALCKLLDVDEETLEKTIINLNERLQNGATRVLTTDNEAQLVTAPELDDVIDTVRKDELKRDIGRAGAETLAIILYRGPISRPEIDRIRGVNSAFILRNLLMRGLVERKPSGNTYTFDITPALLAHLGIKNKQELPNRANILDRLESFEAEVNETE